MSLEGLRKRKREREKKIKTAKEFTEVAHKLPKSNLLNAL